MRKQNTTQQKSLEFNPRTFLSTAGKGRDLVSYQNKGTIFSQGDATEGLFFIQQGKVRISVVSEGGKEATLGILGERDFFGEGGLAGQPLHMSSAVAMTDCLLLCVEKKAMTDALREQPKLSALFVTCLLKRNIRYQDDLVDQLFNSSEKRLARVLLLMAHFGKKGVSEMVVPKLSQETLAEMVGTTRSRVNFFMNRFRKLGYINFDTSNKMEVHSSLLKVVLSDDDDTTLAKASSENPSRSRKVSEPPPERHGAPDKERAKRPRLPGVA